MCSSVTRLYSTSRASICVCVEGGGSLLLLIDCVGMAASDLLSGLGPRS
jgi:hypothetical protein